MMTVAGILKPRRGAVRFEGNDLAGAAPRRIVEAGIALVPENRLVFPSMTVAENLAAGAFTRADSGAIAADTERVYARFPQYRSRAAATQIIEDRINDCFKRSMNGQPLVPESRDMRDMVAYMAFLSLGYPVGAEVDGQGLPRLEPQQGDSARGAAVFQSKCIACHGPKGQGTDIAPPLWGRWSARLLGR